MLIELMRSHLTMIVKSKLQLATIIIFLLYSYQTYSLVIFLNGTSSAGKSSIAIELHRQLKIYFQLFRLDGYRGNVPFKQAVKQAVMDGQNIILDTVIYGDYKKDIEFLKDLDVCFILVYCPVLHLVEHVKKRNASVSGGKRTFFTVLNQFYAMYQVREEGCVGSIYHQDVIEGISFVETANKRKELLKKFYNKFFKVRTQSTIASEMYYDLIVDTSVHSSSQCVDQIVFYLNNSKNYDQFKRNFV